MSTSRQVLLKKTALLPDMTASSSFISPPSRPVPRRSRSVHSQAQLQEGACLSLADELFGVVAALRSVPSTFVGTFHLPTHRRSPLKAIHPFDAHHHSATTPRRGRRMLRRTSVGYFALWNALFLICRSLCIVYCLWIVLLVSGLVEQAQAFRCAVSKVSSFHTPLFPDSSASRSCEGAGRSLSNSARVTCSLASFSVSAVWMASAMFSRIPDLDRHNQTVKPSASTVTHQQTTSSGTRRNCPSKHPTQNAQIRATGGAVLSRAHARHSDSLLFLHFFGICFRQKCNTSHIIINNPYIKPFFSLFL